MGGLLQFGIRTGMDPIDGLEEWIEWVVLVASMEGRGIAQHGIHSFTRETPPYILTSAKRNSFNYTTYLEGDLRKEKLIFWTT